MLNCLNHYAAATNVISKDKCIEIINWGLKHGKRETPKTFADGGPDNSSADFRGATGIFWIRKKEYSDIFLNAVTEINKKLWNLDLTFCEPLQLSVYDPGHFYHWHVDSFHNPTDPFGLGTKTVRKLSFSVALNDKSLNYEGGDLQIFERITHANKVDFTTVQELHTAGSIVVFPSAKDHRVTKITKGRRYSLVGWVHGKPFT